MVIHVTLNKRTPSLGANGQLFLIDIRRREQLHGTFQAGNLCMLFGAVPALVIDYSLRVS